MMDTWHNDTWNPRPWEEPESDAMHRAALDQVLAEWEQRIAEAAPVHCPSYGQTVGEHRSGCDLAWLRLMDGPAAARQDPAAEAGW